MLDIKWIRENPEALDRALVNRGTEPAAARLIALDEARRASDGRGRAYAGLFSAWLAASASVCRFSTRRTERIEIS